jgi:hypothetical protein
MFRRAVKGMENESTKQFENKRALFTCYHAKEHAFVHEQ